MRIKRKYEGMHGQSDSFGNLSNSSGSIIEVKTFQRDIIQYYLMPLQCCYYYIHLQLGMTYANNAKLL